MKSYAFALQKGGTGKSSLAVTIATELAHKGFKTVLVDCDPQGNSSSWLLNDFDHELADALKNEDERIDILECVYESEIENLFVVPTFSVGGDLRNVSNTIRGLKFKKIVVSHLEQHFDYAIFDTSPTFGEFEKSIFIATDEVVPVLRLDEFSKDGLQIFIRNLKEIDDELNIKPAFTKIVLNQQDKRLKNEAAYLESYKEMNKDNKFNLFVIPKDPAFSKAQTLHDVIQNKEFSAKKETLDSITNLAEGLSK